MKKCKLITEIKSLLFLFVLLSSFSCFSQTPVCPYPVTNNEACDITFDYVIYDCASGTSCGGGTNITLSSGQTFNINCPGGCPSGVCNIEILVTDFNGVPISPPKNVSANKILNTLFCPPCCGSNSNFSFTWSANGTSL